MEGITSLDEKYLPVGEKFCVDRWCTLFSLKKYVASVRNVAEDENISKMEKGGWWNSFIRFFICLKSKYTFNRCTYIFLCKSIRYILVPIFFLKFWYFCNDGNQTSGFSISIFNIDACYRYSILILTINDTDMDIFQSINIISISIIDIQHRYSK